MVYVVRYGISNLGVPNDTTINGNVLLICELKKSGTAKFCYCERPHHLSHIFFKHIQCSGHSASMVAISGSFQNTIGKDKSKT